MNAENGAVRLFCVLISLYYTYHLDCRDKTLRLYTKKGRKQRKERGKESEGC